MVRLLPIKINLGLYITGRREDGFHNIESIFYPLPWGDVVEGIPATTFSFTQHGLKLDCEEERNLAVKAFRLLEKELPSSLELQLLKVVPPGKGLGAGSADGTGVLLLLNDLYNLRLSQERLQTLAGELGSDTIFFTQDAPALVSGRGEILQPLPCFLKNYNVTLLLPPFAVSTAAAYSSIRASAVDIAWERVANIDWEYMRTSLSNQFEKPAFHQEPELEAAKRELYDAGALYASMSGSGSSLYAISEIPLNLEIRQGWKKILISL